jgi:hypothetical protein
MLKLGDKSLMGIIIPTVLMILLFAIPYIDRNPYRSLSRRPFAVGLGLLAVVVLIVLSYMGTPHFGIESDAATRIVQDLVPEEGVGPVRSVPYEQLQPGVYIVDETPTSRLCPNLDYGCPDLESLFADYTNRINLAEEEGKLPESDAVLLIDNWQQDLKKVTFRIGWTDELSERQTYERSIYIHRERGGE